MQTRTGKPRGNCTEAAIASVLECDLADVPDLYDPDDDPEASTFRAGTFARLMAWLKERGIMWCNATGAEVTELLTLIPGGRGRHHLIGGVTEGGVGHMVVGLDGDPVWDPNPSKIGLVSADQVVYLLPLDEVPAEYQDWPGIEYHPQRQAAG